MARVRGSISFRLGFWFLVLLTVFAITFLVVLWHIQSLKQTAERLATSQRVATESRELGDMVEKLFAAESDFVYAEEVDYARRNDFIQLSEEIFKRLDELGKNTESPDLVQLRNGVERLSNRFTELMDAKWRAVNSISEEEQREAEKELFMLHQEGRRDLIRINDTIHELALAFGRQTELAVQDAREAWEASMDLTRFVFPAALLVSLLAVYYTYRSITQPVHTLTEGTAALARGELSTRIPVSGSGEFRELAARFNTMARALQSHQQQLVDAEKMASVGRLAAGVAHEINNPLAVILGHARMSMAALPEDAPEREALETIADEAGLCRDIVNSLLDLSRPVDATAGEVFNPADLTGDVVNMMQALNLTEEVDIEASVVDRPLNLAISRGRLRQLLLNIIRNALEVLKDLRDGYLHIEGYVRPRARLGEEMLEEASEDAETFLVLVISDNGPGIPTRNLTRLFEPFYTTKASGTGLGLAISYSIIRAHGGFIQVETAPAEGTTFTVGVPLLEE